MNRAILSMLAAGSLLAGCASAPIYPSLQQKTPVVIDGNPIDWQLPLTYYDKDSKLSFSVSNDSANLYFCFAAYDEPLQMRIIRGGLQIWIDTAGGKAQQIGLLYPDPATMVHGRANWRRDPSGGALQNTAEDFDPIGALRRAFLRSPGEMELKGFSPPIGGVTPVNNAFGIQVGVNWDTMNNVLYYEAAIPFADFLGKQLSPWDTGRIFGMTFTVNGMQHAAGNKGDLASTSGSERGGDTPGEGDDDPGGAGAGMPGGGYGGGGMGHGGGMGRGGGHRGGGSRAEGQNPLQQSQTLWFKLKLAGTTER